MRTRCYKRKWRVVTGVPECTSTLIYAYRLPYWRLCSLKDWMLMRKNHMHYLHFEIIKGNHSKVCIRKRGNLMKPTRSLVCTCMNRVFPQNRNPTKVFSALNLCKLEFKLPLCVARNFPVEAHHLVHNLLSHD